MNDGPGGGDHARAPAHLARPLSFGRPRWINLALVTSLILFWVGVILKFLT